MILVNLTVRREGIFSSRPLCIYSVRSRVVIICKLGRRNLRKFLALAGLGQLMALED